MHFFGSIIKAFALAFSGLIVALGGAWLILASLNFSYGLWHDYDNMAETIDRNSKKNIYKFGFEQTSKAQREDLFRQIITSIHRGGEGLEEITFKVPGQPEQILLIESEVVHLKDVADLIEKGMVVSFIALLIWGGCWWWLWVRKIPPPSFAIQFSSIALFVIAGTALVFIIGPVPVFYKLHVWIFPEGHQWFFYFKESLMATMMHAPVLFGWIAVEWLILALTLFLAIQSLMVLLVKRRAGLKVGA